MKTYLKLYRCPRHDLLVLILEYYILVLGEATSILQQPAELGVEVLSLILLIVGGCWL